MAQLESLRPTEALHVMDLVREAGIDVRDWGNFKGGLAKANRNPKYCYRWAFSNQEVVVLNLWYDGLVEDSGAISLSDNLRATAESRNTKALWKRRAQEFDNAVRFAYENSSCGIMPTVVPPFSFAPLHADSMTPPRPPHTSTALARAISLPVSYAIFFASSEHLSLLYPITAICSLRTGG